MHDLARAAALLRARKPWHTLPQPFYTDQAIFELDLDAIFARSWIMIGFDAELEAPGAYLATAIGRTPIIVLRNKKDEIVGYHNSCRHRGAQICQDGQSRVSRLVCPYHQWTYDLDGSLLRARGMGDDFNKIEHGLRPVRVEVVAGCIYTALSDDAPDFAPFRDALEPALAPHNLRNAKVAHVEMYDEEANWKLVMENGRECHHCLACHPELRRVFPVAAVEAVSIDAQPETDYMARLRNIGFDTSHLNGEWWQIGRFPFNDGVISYSTDGKPLVGKRMTDLNNGDLGSLRWAIEPNNFCHVTGDSAIMVNVEPVSALKTRVTAKWLVHKDAVATIDYDVPRLIEMWDKTNLQDKALAENNQLGVNGQGYTPGPYAPEAEIYVNRFVDWYSDRLKEFCDADDNFCGTRP